MLKEQLFLIDLIVTMLILEQLLNSLHRLNHLAKFKCFNVAFRGRYVRFKRIVLFFVYIYIVHTRVQLYQPRDLHACHCVTLSIM